MIGIAELKEWLQASDEDLSVIQFLEPRAVSFIEQETGRYFGPLLETVEYVDGLGSRTLYLREQPEASPAPIVEEETSLGTWQVVNAAEYVARGRRLVNNVRKWTGGSENYRVTYTRGYEAGAEPPPIRQAVLELVALMYNRRGSDGFKSETIGEYSYTMAELDQESDLAKTISVWRLPVMA